MLIAIAGSLSWIGFSLCEDAEVVIEKLPEAARKLRQNRSAARSSVPTALQNMQEAANEIQGAATDADAKPGTRVIAVKSSESTAWLRDYATTRLRRPHCAPA